MEGLILAYRAFVHLVAEYGNVLMMGASATQMSKLDSMQHLPEPLCSTQFVLLERGRHVNVSVTWHLIITFPLLLILIRVGM